MADVFVRRRRARRDRGYGEMSLSTGEIEYLTRQDEAARRRQRLLQVREQEKRVAQMVTQRYRDNLRVLQAQRLRHAEREHRLSKDVLLSTLHEKYQLSVQGMGTAQRSAREKMIELMELAHIERQKWTVNQRGERERYIEAVEVLEEDEEARLARRREIERNLQRLKAMSSKHRTQASERAKRELQLQLELKAAQDEAQRFRALHAETEEFSFPRKTAKDVTAYQFTRTHCVAVPGSTSERTMTLNKESSATHVREVKVVRHNRLQPTVASAIDQAEVYRREMERRTEEEWRAKEENKKIATSRGNEALHVVESIREGQEAIDWLSAVHEQERARIGTGVAFQRRDLVDIEEEGSGSEAFARLFELDDGSVVASSIDDQERRLMPKRFLVRRLGSADESDESLLDSHWRSVSQDIELDRLASPMKSMEERAIEQKLETMSDMLKRVASFGKGKAAEEMKKSLDDDGGDGQGQHETDAGVSERMRYEDWKRQRAAQEEQRDTKPADNLQSVEEHNDEDPVSASSDDEPLDVQTTNFLGASSDEWRAHAGQDGIGWDRGSARGAADHSSGRNPSKAEASANTRTDLLRAAVRDANMGHNEREKEEDDRGRTLHSRSSTDGTRQQPSSTRGLSRQRTVGNDVLLAEESGQSTSDGAARRLSIDQLEQQLQAALASQMDPHATRSRRQDGYDGPDAEYSRRDQVARGRFQSTRQESSTGRRESAREDEADRRRRAEERETMLQYEDHQPPENHRDFQLSRSSRSSVLETEPIEREEAERRISMGERDVGGERNKHRTALQPTARGIRETDSISEEEGDESADHASASDEEEVEPSMTREQSVLSKHEPSGRRSAGASSTMREESVVTQRDSSRRRSAGASSAMREQSVVNQRGLSGRRSAGLIPHLDETLDQSDGDVGSIGPLTNESEIYRRDGEVLSTEGQGQQTDNGSESESIHDENTRTPHRGRALGYQRDDRSDSQATLFAVENDEPDDREVDEEHRTFQADLQQQRTETQIAQLHRDSIDQDANDDGMVGESSSDSVRVRSRHRFNDASTARDANASSPVRYDQQRAHSRDSGAIANADLRSPVVALDESSDMSDFDPSTMLPDELVRMGAQPYALQMQQEARRLKSSSSSSMLQYSLPLSDSFSSMDSSFVSLEGNTAALANRLLPMFPRRRRQSEESSSAADNRARSSLRRVSTRPDTAIVLNELKQQTDNNGGQESTQLEEQDIAATETISGTTKATTASNADRRRNEEELAAVPSGRVANQHSRQAMRTQDTSHRSMALQDLSFSSDSSSDMSAYIYLTRMRQVAGTSPLEGPGPVTSEQGVRSSQDLDLSSSGGSSVSASRLAKKREGNIPSVAPTRDAERRDSNVSSSSSTPSIDARFQYLVNMTAVAGKALPLHLNLPPAAFGSRNMSVPPPNMHLINSSASESSDAESICLTRQEYHVDAQGEMQQAGPPVRVLPAAPFGQMDMGKPPAPLFTSSSNRSSQADADDSVTSHELASEGHSSESGEPRQYSLDSLKQRLALLPPQPFGALDMSQPPAPLVWDDSEEEESVLSSGVGDHLSESAVSSAHSAASSTRRKAEALFIPLTDDARGDVSLAEAFRQRRAGAQRRVDTPSLLERRREQLEQQRASAATSSSARPQSTALQRQQTSRTVVAPKPDLLNRLATGTRAKITAQEMKERTRRLYNQLPEITERKRQEDVLERRRQRLQELREGEKARRQQQRQRKDNA